MGILNAALLWNYVAWYVSKLFIVGTLETQTQVGNHKNEK
jgi:hypothetical protein